MLVQPALVLFVCCVNCKLLTYQLCRPVYMGLLCALPLVSQSVCLPAPCLIVMLYSQSTGTV